MSLTTGPNIIQKKLKPSITLKGIIITTVNKARVFHPKGKHKIKPKPEADLKGWQNFNRTAIPSINSQKQLKCSPCKKICYPSRSASANLNSTICLHDEKLKTANIVFINIEENFYDNKLILQELHSKIRSGSVFSTTSKHL